MINNSYFTSVDRVIATSLILPPFWIENVEAWSYQVEARNLLKCNTLRENTKYHRTLPPNIITDVMSFLYDNFQPKVNTML